MLCKVAFEYYPFGVIFSKKAPLDLNSIQFDTDFCYFYFSPGLELLTFLKRKNACDGKTNAKRDFPDYKAYFEDDCKVMLHYTEGKVLSFSEPWAPPGIQSYIYTRKTALLSEGDSYMLGCFDLVDDISLGIAKFKRVFHDAYAEVPPMGMQKISDLWFYDAFQALPNGMAIVLENNVVYTNRYWNIQETIHNINQLFKNHGFEIRDQVLLTSSAWLSNMTISNGQCCDIGTYGIQVEGKVVQVLVLRPTMSSTATPCWRAYEM